MDTQTNKKRERAGRAEINRQWLIDSEIQAIAEKLGQDHNPQSLIIFSLILSTGQKFSRLAKLDWSSFNGRLGIIRIADRSIRLTETVAKGLELLREQATGEKQKLFSLKYEKFWHYLARACARSDIPEIGVLELRNTFALKHWQTYQSKARLKDDLGLYSLRYLPKEIFQARPAPLFQGVL